MLTNRIRWIVGSIGFIAITAVYLFHNYNIGGTFFSQVSQEARFILGKTFRFLVNDAASLMIIAALFNGRKYLRIGYLLFLFELLVLLPVYFFLKLYLEGDSEISSPLLSQLHRLIVNPLLMLILIVGFFIQEHKTKSR